MKSLKANKMVVFAQALLLVFTVSGCTKIFSKVSGEAPPPAKSWSVVKISDGDTLKLRQTNGQEMKVRLICIDAPETRHGKNLGQPLGEESKSNLKRLIDEADGIVEVSVIDRDRYGRAVAEVYTTVNGQQKFINEEQVKDGMALAYSAYLNKCPNRIAIENAEAIAKSQRKGVWSGEFERPWDYRKRMRD